MGKRAAIVALVCAVVGLGASVAASYTHYHLLFDPTYRSFCDVSATISCTQVYASRFSTPHAMRGSTHNICSAVMMPSRPNVVEYQGMPA